jgi:ech hydrogenase subunit F
MSLFSMSKLLFKSLFHGSYTGKYPIEPKVNYAQTRGKIDIEISECIFCGMCEKRCPTDAIKVDREQKQWTIERLRCIQCGYCVEVCPKKCLSMNNQYTAPTSQKSKDVFTCA